MNRIYRIFNSCQKCFEKYQGQPKKLQDLSFTGQKFYTHNLNTLIKKLPINHTYITDDYQVDNYIVDNISVSVRKKIN
tara:strand:- start:42 stop:275 length:234 start_codon:yes stop_codon:yes gene_type:complete